MMMLSGRRIITLRMSSTQKFPMVDADFRERPYVSPTRTARPVAAEVKFWTHRPIIWVR